MKKLMEDWKFYMNNLYINVYLKQQKYIIPQTININIIIILIYNKYIPIQQVEYRLNTHLIAVANE